MCVMRCHTQACICCQFFLNPQKACVRRDADKWTRLAHIHALIIQTTVHQQIQLTNQNNIFLERATLLPSACEIAREYVSVLLWLLTLHIKALRRPS